MNTNNFFKIESQIDQLIINKDFLAAEILIEQMLPKGTLAPKQKSLKLNLLAKILFLQGKFAEIVSQIDALEAEQDIHMLLKAQRIAALMQLKDFVEFKNSVDILVQSYNQEKHQLSVLSQCRLMGNILIFLGNLGLIEESAIFGNELAKTLDQHFEELAKLPENRTALEIMFISYLNLD